MAGVGVPIRLSSFSIRGPAGVEVHEVELTAAAGDVVAIVGPAGSGASALLLAIAGRLRPVHGVARIGAFTLPGQAAVVRRLVAVARIAGAIEPDRHVAVADLVAETRAAAGGRLDDDDVAEAMDAVGVSVRRYAHYGELHPADQVRLCVALAAATNPAALVVDDVDAGLDRTAADQVWQGLRALAGTGPTVVASGADTPPSMPDVDHVVRLPHPTGRARRPAPNGERA